MTLFPEMGFPVYWAALPARLLVGPSLISFPGSPVFFFLGFDWGPSS